MFLYDAVVIGCGAVGAAVARELTLRGRKKVLICEKNDQPISEASAGNTGHLATNFYYTASRAPLEFLLTRRASRTSEEWLRTQPNIPRQLRGMLFVAFSQEELEKLNEMREAGIENGEELQMLSREQVYEKEPGLRVEGILGGLWSPREYIVDSWLMAMSNLYVALAKGCQLKVNCKITSIEKCTSENGDNYWLLQNNEGETFSASTVFNCAGNFSDEVHNLIQHESSFSIKPAKGQFLVLNSSFPRRLPLRTILVMTPSKATGGLYLFETAYGEGQLVIGPTRKDQESKRDKECEEEVERELLEHAQRMLKSECLEGMEKVETFSGLRPACQHYDYQIHATEDHSWLTVGAIRSTGLSASRAIAEYACDLILGGEEREEGQVEKGDDPVMPTPKVVEEKKGIRLKIGDYEFAPSHPLSRIAWEGKGFRNSTE